MSPAESRPIRPINHPLRLLLYLEWSLLAIAFLSELVGPLFPGPRMPRGIGPEPPFSWVSPLDIACIVGFGLMGLRLPTGQMATRIGFVLLEGVLILLATAGDLREMRLFSFLVVVFALRSCLIFALPGRLMTTGIAYGLFLAILTQRLREVVDRIPVTWRVGASLAKQHRPRGLPAWSFAYSSALLLGLTLVFLLLLVDALLTERQSREKLTAANAQLRNYALRVEKLAMAQERSRIAREIHDSLGHSLTALNLQVEGALKLWQSDPQRAHQFLKEAKVLGSTALQDVRQSVATMRADPLQEQSLEAAIALLARNVEQVTGVAPICQIHLDAPLPADLSTSLYRIVQEAFTNICKYARPSQILLDLQDTAATLHLLIQDDGVGFDPAQNLTGFGLQSMRERAESLGGIFDLQTSPGQGCTITVHIPLERIVP
ncbi:sensor histidine kinase [Leptolyngbya sp. O-77]|uniref:sensor histidine kinase n=1 Tax=Leptolyngbya sp. O-77 TaxID=1080068 RepID=UPI00074D29D0|nr:sensor histidine kinase [Leptolyngbya sp. O-77]BAU44999.1 Sensor histidine kinase DesK [Leptolyngbya sp. O-77]